jgi:hypothetical protein
MVDSEESAEVKAEPAPEFKLLRQGRWRLVTAASFVACGLAWQSFRRTFKTRSHAMITNHHVNILTTLMLFRNSGRKPECGQHSRDRFNDSA